MENGIYFNGVKIEFTPDQVALMRDALRTNDGEGTDGIMLSDIPADETFTHCGYEFIVLEHLEDGGTVVCFKNLVKENVKFGNNNNYNGSNVDDICHELAEEVTDTIEFALDLTLDDGLDDYGVIEREVALMTADIYRKYVRILDKHKTGKWWWLATAWSTATHDNADYVKCVSPSGCINGISFNVDIGVRPLLYLKSSIFESR